MSEQYDSFFSKFGEGDSRSLGWSSTKEQVERFKVFLSAGVFSGQSILDVGSGFGDLYNFFLKKGIRVDYTGIEINENFFEISNKKFGNYENFSVLNQDFDSFLVDKDFDWVFASGFFSWKDENWDTQTYGRIKKMLSVSSLGCVFNVLTGEPDSEMLKRVDKEFFIREIVAPLSKDYEVFDNYLEGDLTVYLKSDPEYCGSCGCTPCDCGFGSY